ncbi:MAG: S41 family peptidase [Rhodospirillales bacterium]|nr:S41 family peptidase [Rhodospirillales bacterium]
MRVSSRRLKTGLLLGATFFAGIGVVPLARLAAVQLGVTPARAEVENGNADTYRWLTLFGDVFERVRRDYVDPVTAKRLVQNALDGMLSGLDPHSAYMNAQQFRDMEVQTSGQFGGLGIEVTEDSGLIRVIAPIDDTPASRAGIKAGDLITAIDGKTVEGVPLSDAVRKMRGPVNSAITLTIKRQGIDTPVVVTLKREIIHIKVVKDRMEPHDIGYVRLSQFTEGADAGIKKAVAQLKKDGGGKLRGLVLDLRDNPGGLLEQAVAVAGDFVNHGEIVSTRGRHPSDSQRWDASGHDLIPGVPMVVLINNGSASSSEIVSGALQDHRRAILMGERSFGKGSVQTVIPLPGGGAMRLTTARYYTPSGRSIQDLGIAPDIKVAETAKKLAHFGPAHESDLNHTISNTGGTHTAPPRPDLPPVAGSIPARPPKDFPKFDPKHPTKTDFQLLQALRVLDAMAATSSQHAVAKE